ncbi:MAG: TylF/MycF/NovP-related O-methyltransferase [Candidatus Latescibacterota bacterium]
MAAPRLVRLLDRLLRPLGYEAQPRRRPAGAAECEELIGRIRASTMVARPGLVSLYEQALFCEQAGVPGAFVECGVWKGGAVGLMALVNLRHGRTRRHLHLFDAFGDICQPDPQVDGERAVREAGMGRGVGELQGNLVPLAGFYAARGGPGTLEENRRLLECDIGYDPGFVHYHAGWFQQTLPIGAPGVGSIAILRLDADWYASTRVCLEHLFAQVVAGGFVVIDDYGAYDGCRRAVDEFLARGGRPHFLHRCGAEIRYLVVP